MTCRQTPRRRTPRSRSGCGRRHSAPSDTLQDRRCHCSNYIVVIKVYQLHHIILIALYL